MDYKWMRKIYKRYRMGDPISDKDLIRSIDFLNDLIPKVEAFGETSRLFRDELIRMRSTFNDRHQKQWHNHLTFGPEQE